MSNPKLQVFEPAMCCETGVCGPDVDQTLVRFSGDVEWLRAQGVEVERFNLAKNPAAFAESDTVREALTVDADCLPLVLKDGGIVSRGAYPDRAALASFLGLLVQVAPETAVATAAACGPDCGCHAGPNKKRQQTVASVLALLAVVGILAYKGMHGTPLAAEATSQTSNFAAVQTVPNATAMVTADQDTAVASAARPEAKQAPEASQPSAKSSGGMGEPLKTLNDLNTKALDTDAVFIYVPGSDDKEAPSATKAAAKAARSALEKQKVKVGSFVLPAGTDDYKALAKQVAAPALLVAVKGKGMLPVTGECTEAKVLQAYVSASSAGGGCGSGSSCAPGASCP